MTEMLALSVLGAAVFCAALSLVAFIWGYHQGYSSGYDDGRTDGWRSARGR